RKKGLPPPGRPRHGRIAASRVEGAKRIPPMRLATTTSPPRTPADDDRSLAHDAARGDRRAFDRLVARYLDRTLRICLRLVGNLEDAEDTVQETFARAHARLQSFAGRSTFGTWITSIALRLCADLERARRSRRRRITELSADFDLDRDLASPRAHSPARHAEER